MAALTRFRFTRRRNNPAWLIERLDGSGSGYDRTHRSLRASLGGHLANQEKSRPRIRKRSTLNQLIEGRFCKGRRATCGNDEGAWPEKAKFRVDAAPGVDLEVEECGGDGGTCSEG